MQLFQIYFVDCGNPPNVTHGSVNNTHTTYGSIAYYKCDSGYNLIGENQVYCNETGNWTETNASCEIQGL